MENLRLGASAVQHDMKREETVEEVEKNTELERQTPKRQATGSNPAGGAKNDRCKPFFDGLQRFYYNHYLYTAEFSFPVVWQIYAYKSVSQPLIGTKQSCRCFPGEASANKAGKLQR